MTYLVAFVSRSELPAHHLLVLVWVDDADDWAAEGEEDVEWRFFLLTAPAHHTVGFSEHRPGTISFIYE